MKPLRKFSRDLGGPVLVLHDDSSAHLLVSPEPEWEVHPLSGLMPERQRWAGVAVVVADRGALRASVSTLPRLGRTKALACLVTEDDRPTHLAPRPDWPPVVRHAARRLPAGGSLTLLHLQGPMPAHVLLRELARVAGTSRPAPERIVLDDRGQRRRPTLPPEVVVRADRSLPAQSYHPAAAPAPAVVTDPRLVLGPLDEGVLNPIGFHSTPDQREASLERPQRVGPGTIATLRQYGAVRVHWSDRTPELARTVAALAMAGVPLVGGAPPAAARPWLGDLLYEELSDGRVDVTDPLRREEHSVRLRRAALLTHSGPGWRARVSAAAGGEGRRFPTCSVVLATRRPEHLESALRQVARQRGVTVELVVAAHGFDAAPDGWRDLVPDLDVSLVSLPREALFGDVLNAGVAVASGEVVVKMDDDDFYGPDFLLDLLLAREYSGADVVGTPAEFVYLEQQDLTVRRHGTGRDASERFASIVAGGTMMLSRAALSSVGGFQPVHRFVDHQLLTAVRSVGGTVYRSHGLGFMLRRSSGGHTWGAPDDHFTSVDRLHQQWPGFTPTRILEPDDTEATR